MRHRDAAGGLKTSALYVVATPLGNLGDIGARALEVLRGADAIACEDTRHTRRLLDHFGIRAETFSLHEHNEAASAERLVGCCATAASSRWCRTPARRPSRTPARAPWRRCARPAMK